MIIVTGTKRSGTSMWMDILQKAGLPILGEQFPVDWENKLKDANPGGFFESRLRDGINFTSNPDPNTGFYLSPSKHHGHAIKLFIPGLVRSDLAFVDKVVATIRPWREFSKSITRLRQIEDSHRQEGAEIPKYLTPELEWWSENFALLKDFACRKYPLYMVSYDNVLSTPEKTIGEIINWIGTGDVVSATSAIKKEYRTQKKVAYTPHKAITTEIANLFDELYQRVDQGLNLELDFLDRLNATNLVLLPIINEEIAVAQTIVDVNK